MTKKEIQNIIVQEWKECEKVLTTFAGSKGVPLEDLKENKFLLKPSPELVVWNCKGVWRDRIKNVDEEGILELLSVKIAGRVMEKICREMV